MRKKIIATVGPASLSQKIITNMDRCGVDLFRINLSHTRLDDFSEIVKSLRRWTDKPICPDTEGAQLRTGVLSDGEISLRNNDEIQVTGPTARGPSHQLNLNIENPGRILKAGDVLNIDFNGAIIQVLDIVNDDVVLARVLRAGQIGSNKGVGIDRLITLPYLSAKDRKTLDIVNALGLDTVFLSFCSSSQDVVALRELFDYEINVVSKIETRLGLINLNDICASSEAILLDRGDLSRDVQLEKIAYAQRYVLDQAKNSGTPVYIATNLMESMLHKSQPTRAEINDIVGALNAGASGLVLAAETAIGRYPDDSVRILSEILQNDYNKSQDTNVPYLFEFSSSFLNEPHGGQLIQQFYEGPKEALQALPAITVSDRTLADFMNICLGAYSPVTAFMDVDEIESVIETYRLKDGTPWTVPITLQVHSSDVKSLPSQGPVVIKTAKLDEVFGVFYLAKQEALSDLEEHLQQWFNTESHAHPGIHRLFADGDVLLSGRPLLVRDGYLGRSANYALAPRQTRALFHQCGWRRILGFHANDVPHKGHEFAQNTALQDLEGDCLFISLALGARESGQFRPGIVTQCYKALIENSVYEPYPALVGGLNTYRRHCGVRELGLSAICLRNFGCSHFLVDVDAAKSVGVYDFNQLQNMFEKMAIDIPLVLFDDVVFDASRNMYCELKSSSAPEHQRALNNSLVKEAIAGKFLDTGYLLHDSVHACLTEMLEQGERLLE